jgi:hypothetical protein
MVQRIVEPVNKNDPTGRRSSVAGNAGDLSPINMGRRSSVGPLPPGNSSISPEDLAMLGRRGSLIGKGVEPQLPAVSPRPEQVVVEDDEPVLLLGSRRKSLSPVVAAEAAHLVTGSRKPFSA